MKSKDIMEPRPGLLFLKRKGTVGGTKMNASRQSHSAYLPISFHLLSYGFSDSIC
jgi:hypothetical protein